MKTDDKVYMTLIICVTIFSISIGVITGIIDFSKAKEKYEINNEIGTKYMINKFKLVEKLGE
uniref:Uncharacterized protein n=1 Tax=viral metagenome TaxID=1070528 RepID=A0A6M3JRY6_9ZZZZ